MSNGTKEIKTMTSRAAAIILCWIYYGEEEEEHRNKATDPGADRRTTEADIYVKG